MKVAVISDTHDRLPDHVLDALQGADEIWHLGDVTSPHIIESISRLGPRVRVVRGNCDTCTAWPLTADFALCGHLIHLEHIPPRQPAEPYALLLHGHTHIPRDEVVRGTRFLNPGTVGKPNKGVPASYAWLTLNIGEAPIWEIVRV